MRGVFILFILSYVSYSKALECGILKPNSDQFKKVMTECVKDNQTLSKIWDMTSSDSAEEDSSMSTDEEEVPITRGMVNNKKQKAAKARRSRRSKNSKFNDSPRSNTQRKNGGSSPTTTEESTTLAETQSEENTKMNNVGDSDDMCVLQCVFEKLEMTDSNGLPDHKKFVDTLLKSASGREMRDFVQESTDDCFQEMEQEDTENTCQYSTKLMTCLAGKGKLNCEDWPAGNLPLF